MERTVMLRKKKKLNKVIVAFSNILDAPDKPAKLSNYNVENFTLSHIYFDLLVLVGGTSKNFIGDFARGGKTQHKLFMDNASVICEREKSMNFNEGIQK